MIYIIDHQDSFTWNIAHQVALYDRVEVVDHRCIDRVDFAEASALIFSPGPGQPCDYPDSLALYHTCVGHVPLLGICLGFQLILVAEGATILPQPRVLHGIQSTITYHADTITYQGVTGPLNVGRYHALQIERASMPEGFMVTSWDSDTQTPLSFEHEVKAIFGLQYHPDSFLTEYGNIIIKNIFNELGQRSQLCSL